MEVKAAWGNDVSASWSANTINLLCLLKRPIVEAIGLLCRNIFSDKKYVEEYRVADVQTELGLDQVRS